MQQQPKLHPSKCPTGCQCENAAAPSNIWWRGGVACWSRDPWDPWGSVYTAVPVQRRQSHGTTSWPRERATDRQRRRGEKVEVRRKIERREGAGGWVSDQWQEHPWPSTSQRCGSEKQQHPLHELSNPPHSALPLFLLRSSIQSLQMAKLLIKYLISTKTEKTNRQKRISVFV